MKGVFENGQCETMGEEVKNRQKKKTGFIDRHLTGKYREKNPPEYIEKIFI